jgi:tetratricopeptide (TPR) repeat protein
VLALFASAVSAEDAAPDPRIEEADALLGERSGFEPAAALYRAVLADRPDAPLVRLKLARVLAWDERWDESIAEFDALLDAAPADRELALERAEVLSWAGRTDPALAAFDAVLAEAPDDARAARGRARTLRWAGRAGDADRAYARALELEDDAELREEWAVLRAGYPPRGGAEFEYLEDSDGYRRIGAAASASYFFDLDTQLTARAGYLDVEHSVEGAPAELAEADRAFEISASGRRALGERWLAVVELGARVWREAGAMPLVRADLQYSSRGGTVMGLGVDHRDALDRTGSLAAVEDGVRDTLVRATAWRGWRHGIESFAEIQAGLLTDSNTRVASGASLSWQPWEAHELRLHASGSYLGYTDESDLYYDPELDVSGELAASFRRALIGTLVLDVECGGGYGHAEQAGEAGRGPAYRVGAALAWRLGRFRFSVGGSHARSQRASVYTANRAVATIGVDLGR